MNKDEILAELSAKLATGEITKGDVIAKIGGQTEQKQGVTHK